MAAPDKEKAEEKSEAPAPKPAGRGGTLVLALLGVNTLLLVAVLAVMMLKLVPGASHAVPAVGAEDSAQAAAGTPADGDGGKPAEKPAAVPVEKPKAAPPGNAPPGPTVRLPDFVVHLRDADSERYARMAFELEVGADPDKDKIQAHLPRLRDAFLGYLSDRAVADLRGSENITRLKQSLLEIVQQQVPNVPVRALYITDLVIQ